MRMILAYYNKNRTGMRGSWFLIFLFILTSTLSAQVILDKTSHDFGIVNKEDKKYVDFRFTNISDKDISIAKYDTPYGVSVRFSNKVIEVDESILVRIKYTPKRKGEFTADIPVYLSSNNEPFVLSIKGKALTFDVNESLEVPEFSEKTEKKSEETFELNILIVRKDDGSRVQDAELDIIWDGVMYRHSMTGPEGEIKDEFVPDKYYLVVKAKGLGRFESELSIHSGMNDLKIELGPEGTLSQVIQDSADTYETEIVTVAEDNLPIATEPVILPELPTEEENPGFPKGEFAPNNIVFLIDVSVSMKQKGKMNLLKSSLVELTNLLRSVDKVAIVTYSSGATLALKSTSASQKSEIIAVIKSLEARGSTSGQKGLKKAYQVLESNKIPGGNNQVFISTDGAFNLERQDKGMLSTVRKNAKKGYKISVIGIKNEKWTVKNMKKIAQEGQGNYIHINTYDDARRSLVNEVKIQSKAK